MIKLTNKLPINHPLLLIQIYEYNLVKIIKIVF